MATIGLCDCEPRTVRVDDVTRFFRRWGLGRATAAMAGPLFLGALAFAAPAANEPPGPPPVAEPYVPPNHPDDLLRLDEPMRQYFASRITAPRESVARLQQIVDTIVLPGGLHVVYDGEATFDVRETFRRRRGNCVGFALLVVAVTREFGFHASFQNIDAKLRWNRYGDIIVAVQHLNVRVETDDGDFVVDPRRDLIPNVRPDMMQLVSDQRAFADFYCDVGFFRLVHDSPDEALRYMTLATEVDPGNAGAWTNRANLHARLGDVAMARTCYEAALRADRNDLTAIVGLAAVLHRIGTPEALTAAEKLDRRARWVESRNPYIQQHIALQAQERGDWAGAEKRLRRAIALKDDEPEFYVQLIAALRHLGRDSDAQRTERKLEKLRVQVASADDGSSS